MGGRPSMAALRLRQFHEANTRQEGESTLHSLRPRSRTEHTDMDSLSKFTLLLQSNELTGGPPRLPELVQHFRLLGEFTSTQGHCMA
jgi:hypothetical protein